MLLKCHLGPDRDTIFHQFHRAADQAPIVALSQLIVLLPDHAEWMQWYATVARYAEYQKQSATITAPFYMLPAYVYRVVDSVQVPDSGGRYQEKQSEYAEQVRAGTPMGEGWYLRTFPVWFSRRGNYGVLLSQAKALAAALERFRPLAPLLAGTEIVGDVDPKADRAKGKLRVVSRRVRRGHRAAEAVASLAKFLGLHA